MNKKAITEICQTILAQNPVFLDTETTGLEFNDEICEIALVDVAGEVIVNTLVKPTIPISSGARAVHGITDRMVFQAPAFSEVIHQLAGPVAGRPLVIYNAEFDWRMLEQSAVANDITDLDCIVIPSATHCAMQLYAEYWGDWNNYHHSYRWQRLGDARRQQSISDKGITLHRALADAEITRRLFHVMANSDEVKNYVYQ